MSDSGSPSPYAGEGKSAEVTYKFCTECQNLLYPKEERSTGKLLYFCKTCKHTEESNSACAWRNQLNSAVTATAGEIEDVASDPTVGVPCFCTLCGEELRCGSCGGLVEEDALDTSASETSKL